MFNLAALKKAAVVGAAGTVVMTVYSFVAHYAHLPTPDFHGMIAGIVPAAGTIGTWVAYFAVGVVLAYLYKAFFQAKLPAHSWMSGLYYGFLVFLFTEIILMPILGMGFFAGNMSAALGVLLGLATYGAAVGYLYEHK